MNSDSKKIKKLYENLSYFDQYGGAVFLVILYTLITFIGWAYFYVMKSANAIKADWTNQKCNPTVIPFAGIINKPADQSIGEFTSNNFTTCIQNMIVNFSGYALQPFNYITHMLTNVFGDMASSIDAIRNMMNNIRSDVTVLVEDIFGRILNVIIALQKMIIALSDSMAKMQGILVASLYTALGIYDMLQAVLGAIVQFIIEILVVLSILIIGLWIFPFTWTTAALMTLIFLAIAIPLGIVCNFMTQTLHIQTAGVPGLSCFDKDTEIDTECGVKKMSELCVNDVTRHSGTITAIFKLNAVNVDMYNVNGVIVSGTHMIKYNKEWMLVAECPISKLISYAEPYIYCLNTTSKKIIINNIVFGDWDELYSEQTRRELNIKTTKIHKYFDGGFVGTTKVFLKNGECKEMQDVDVNDILAHGEIVYGIVKIKGDDLNIRKYSNFKGVNLTYLEESVKIGEKQLYLHHLLTNTSIFQIDDTIFNDYNFLVNKNLLSK